MINSTVKHVISVPPSIKRDKRSSHGVTPFNVTVETVALVDYSMVELFNRSEAFGKGASSGSEDLLLFVAHVVAIVSKQHVYANCSFCGFFVATVIKLHAYSIARFSFCRPRCSYIASDHHVYYSLFGICCCYCKQKLHM